jgi:hypothetical protein
MQTHRDVQDSIMQMVKIHIPERKDRATALEVLTLRGRVICLPDNHFIVPEPALDTLKSLAVGYQELERGGIDYAEKALRDSIADPIQRRATG